MQTAPPPESQEPRRTNLPEDNPLSVFFFVDNKFSTISISTFNDDVLNIETN